MEIVEFSALASAQQPIVKDRRVSVHGPDLAALLQSGRAIPLLEVLNHPDQTYEVKRFTYGHILEPGATDAQISSWAAEHPSHLIPDDLKAVLKQVNGIHLWADLAKKRSYFGVLPVAEWRDAATWEWGLLFIEPPTGLVAMSYHENGDFYLILDTVTGVYYWYDTEDFGRPTMIGRSASELLGWWWTKAQDNDPRIEPTT